MRYFQIAAGIRLPVYSEEQELLDRIPEHKFLTQKDLDEREQEIARLMVSRGVLAQKVKDGVFYYRPNSDMDIWRDR